MDDEEKRLLNRVLSDQAMENLGNAIQRYSVFTTEFDRIVDWNDLNLGPLEEGAIPSFARWLSPNLWFDRGCQHFGADMDGVSIDVDGLMPDASIIVLADHSGSLKNKQRRISAWLILELLDRMFLRAGIPFEILGYTTSSWKGGDSRKEWKELGGPERPGRLCDLLHIVYRAFEDRSAAGLRYQTVLNLSVLKENVDGEAVRWAAERLKLREGARRRFILVVSDGVPVDESTCRENGMYFLVDDLELAILEIDSSPDWKIGAVVLGAEPFANYPAQICVPGPEDIAKQLPSFLRNFLELPATT